jgi:hypothetical protein
MTIDEKVLRDRILLKKEQARHITNISELLLIIVYAGAGAFILDLNVFRQRPIFFMYLLAVWVLGIALYLLMRRVRRLRRDKNRFEQSMRGDLDHAISMAAYQVRLSRFMRWNMLPVGLFVLFSLWEGGKSIWVAGGTLTFFAFAWYAGGFEHSIYKARKRELQIFQKSLGNER